MVQLEVGRWRAASQSDEPSTRQLEDPDGNPIELFEPAQRSH
jgi:hypothetical protein